MTLSQPHDLAEERAIPRIAGDQSMAFLAEGYRFGQRRFDEYGADAFRTHLMGRPVLFLRGTEAARFFYEGQRFTRSGAMPRSVQHSLQDEGSVQALVGEAHHERKALFLNLLDEREQGQLRRCFRDEWDAAIGRWGSRRVRLYDEAADVLTRAACAWAGISIDAADARRRSIEFVAMINGAGSFGPKNWRGRALRLRTEKWARTVVQQARESDDDSVVTRLVRYRDADGGGLDDETAAVELLNLVRPTVAVAHFITFAALALERHPRWAEHVRESDDQLRSFVQEVRRTAPFFPLVGGTADRQLTWMGEEVAEGAWVMLDLFATNRDARVWDDPLMFRPERHDAGPSPKDALIAQGAGDYADGHRCPGEPATIELLEEAVLLLTRSMRYDVPEQNLRVDLGTLPARPASGFLIENVTS
ncbi:cytochrome P450 [Paramicrobacterium fandaimingii]|uniref:cytochrome P450 n=1 Tax=Paramicrobacterium fandaimingii TaxID=2708079 RepID=UPI00141E1337|nr:cytochrome P450 [Microbacterium fandaimingii]